MVNPKDDNDFPYERGDHIIGIEAADAFTSYFAILSSRASILKTIENLPFSSSPALDGISPKAQK